MQIENGDENDDADKRNTNHRGYSTKSVTVVYSIVNHYTIILMRYLGIELFREKERKGTLKDCKNLFSFLKNDAFMCIVQSGKFQGGLEQTAILTGAKVQPSSEP